MNIKVLILDHDKRYIDGLYNAFKGIGAENIELYCLDTPNGFSNLLSVVNPNLCVISEKYTELVEENRIDRNKILVLTSERNISEYKGFNVLFRYQSVPDIKDRLLRTFDEVVKKDIKYEYSGGHGRVVLFTSPAGGCGVTSVAVAFAMSMSEKGYKTIYLELNMFQSSGLIFRGGGKFTYSDVIYALIQNRNNLGIRLSNYADEDITGVRFYHEAENQKDMAEMKAEETKRLINALKEESDFEYIIVDINVTGQTEFAELTEICDRIVIVSDGMEMNNYKVEHFIEGFIKSSAGSERKIQVFYNRFGSKTGRHIENLQIREAGGINRVENGNAMEIIKYLKNSNAIEEIGFEG